MMTLRILLPLACSVALLGGCDQQRAPSANATAETSPAANEQAIRGINQRWLDLIRAKDAAGIAQLYAEDGVVMPSNEPAAQGREAVGQWWGRAMQTPGYDLTFQTEQLVLSASGDMALDRGTYRFAANGPDGPIQDAGKYVVVWRKIGDEWKVAADIFNSNQPAAG